MFYQEIMPIMLVFICVDNLQSEIGQLQSHVSSKCKILASVLVCNFLRKLMYECSVLFWGLDYNKIFLQTNYLCGL